MELRAELGPEPSEVAHARHLVAAQLPAWNIPDEPAETTVLLVSELVTNALRHGHPPFLLTACTTPTGVRVEVHDSNGSDYPSLREVKPDLPGGRGLRLVEVLADRWGSGESEHGKLVWFEVDIEPEGD